MEYTLADIMRSVERLETLVVQAIQPKQPGLTVTAFCKQTGMSRTTAHKKISDGLIRKEKGRIPYSELRKFLS